MRINPWIIAAVVATVLAANAAGAQDRRNTQAGVSQPRSTYNPVLTPQASRNVDDMRSVVKHTARAHIERSTHDATNGRAYVTSRDRTGGPLASAAHDRGAVDFGVRGSRDLHRDAANIARRVGPNHTVIVEEPGRHRDRHTSYKVQAPFSEVRTNTYTQKPRATGTHIHVQPNYGIQR